jgi:hypothetical protein
VIVKKQKSSVGGRPLINSYSIIYIATRDTFDVRTRSIPLLKIAGFNYYGTRFMPAKIKLLRIWLDGGSNE